MSDMERPKMTAFDQIVAPEQMQMLKAMIPYAAPPMQRFLSVYAKVSELQNTLSVFGKSSSEMSVCAVPESAKNPTDMLNDLREHCSPATRSKIDECMNMIAMLQMIDILQDSNNE